MADGSLSRRYARALIELGENQQDQDRLVGDLDSFSKVLDTGDGSLRAALTNPGIPVKLHIACDWKNQNNLLITKASKTLPRKQSNIWRGCCQCFNKCLCDQNPGHPIGSQRSSNRLNLCWIS